MSKEIRIADTQDKEQIVRFAMELSRFNRKNHGENCCYDDFGEVLKAIKENAEKSFDERSENDRYLIAFVNNIPVGYALGRIFEQDKNADNGTGRMGLFDELFLSDEARGHGLGSELMDGIMEWFKEKEIHRVKLHAYAWNENARKIYEKRGFRPYVVSYELFC